MNPWLKIILAAEFFLTLSMAMITPIFAIFVEEIGGGILEASATWAIFTFLAGFLTYIFGRFANKTRHYRHMLVYGYALRALAFLGYWFVTDISHLYVLQVFLGISFAMTLSVRNTLYSDHLDKGQHATEWSNWEAQNAIVKAIGALIGGSIAAFFGFAILFLIMFLFSLTGAIIASRLFLQKTGLEYHNN